MNMVSREEQLLFIGFTLSRIHDIDHSDGNIR